VTSDHVYTAVQNTRSDVEMIFPTPRWFRLFDKVSSAVAGSGLGMGVVAPSASSRC
jgi:hypothetical protein